jgi:hypothetical protein
VVDDEVWEDLERGLRYVNVLCRLYPLGHVLKR